MTKSRATEGRGHVRVRGYACQRVTGSFTMFDRLIFKGHLTGLHKSGGISAFLWSQGYPLTEWSRYTQDATGRSPPTPRRWRLRAVVRTCTWTMPPRAGRGRPKKSYARSIAERDGMTEELISVLSIVEPARSFDCRPDPNTHRLEARRRQRKCVHHYIYLVDPEFGFMHICIQAWLPYTIQIWINGRGWLARSSTPPVLAMCATRTPSSASTTSRRRPICANVPRTGPGLGRLTPSPAGSTRCWTTSSRPTSAVTTGCRSGRGRHRRHVHQPAALQAVWPDLVRHASLNIPLPTWSGSWAKLIPLSRPKSSPTPNTTRWVAGQAPPGPQLDKDLRQGLGLQGRKTINNPREFESSRRHRRAGPARAAVEANEQRRRQHVALLPSRHRGQPALPQGTGLRTTERQRRSRPRRLVPEPHQTGPPLRPLQPSRPRRPPPSSGPSWPENTPSSGSATPPSPPASTPTPQPPPRAQRRCAPSQRLIAKLRGHGLVTKVPHQRLYRITRHGQKVMTAALARPRQEIPFPEVYLRAA